MKKKEYGGKRKGSGRKKREKTRVMRIPESLVGEVEARIKAHKQSRVENEES